MVDSILMEEEQVMVMEEVASLRRKGSHKELQLEWAALLSWHRDSPAGQLVVLVLCIYEEADARCF